MPDRQSMKCDSARVWFGGGVHRVGGVLGSVMFGLGYVFMGCVCMAGCGREEVRGGSAAADVLRGPVVSRGGSAAFGGGGVDAAMMAGGMGAAAMGGARPADGYLEVVNAWCPVMPEKAMERRVAEALTREFEGRVVGFCCDDCVAAWASLGDEDRRGRLARGASSGGR